MTHSLKTVILQAFCDTGPAALQGALIEMADRFEQLEANIQKAMRLGEMLADALPQETRDIVIGVFKEVMPEESGNAVMQSLQADHQNIMRLPVQSEVQQ